MEQGLQLRKNPAVEAVVERLRAALVWRPAVNGRVGDEEAIGIPQGDDDIAQALLDALFGKTHLLGLHGRRVEQIEPQGVGTVGLEHFSRIGIVLQALAQLASIGG